MKQPHPHQPDDMHGDERPVVEDAAIDAATLSIGRRVLYMLALLVIYSIVEILAKAVMIVQLIWRLGTGKCQRYLLEFGTKLSAYMFTIWRFLVFCDELPPWPFQQNDRK